MDIKNTKPAIGIHLGNYDTQVAVWVDSKVEVISNSFGNRSTPSLIGFKEN